MARPRMYSSEFDGVSVSASVDIWELSASTFKPIELHALFLGQSTNVGNSTEEILRIQLIQNFGTSGSGGAAAAKRALDPGSAASVTDVERCNTTLASAGTPVNMLSLTWNTRFPLQLIFTPDMRLFMPGTTSFLVVRLMAAPAAAINLTSTIYFWEF